MKLYSIYLLAMIIFLSCHKDSDEVITIIENPDPPTIRITTRLVSVWDTAVIEANHPVQTFAGQSASFDLIPFGQIKGSGIDRDYELIRLSTADNFQFCKVQSLVENDVNYTHLSIPALSSFSGHTSVNGTYSIAPDAELHIPAHSMTSTDGTIYQGEYIVSLTSMDPGDDSGLNIPSYTGILKTNEVTCLEVHACYYIAVRSTDGSQLICTGAAYISFPPSTLDQGWIFNMEEGIWNALTLSTETEPDRIYIRGSGYYASATAKPVIRVSGTLMMNGTPSPHYPVRITYADQQRVIYTTNKGNWALQLPSKTECTAHITLPCGDKQELLLTTSSAAEMEIPLEVAGDEFENALILGRARDCNLNEVSNHLTLLQGESHTVIFTEEPDIHLRIPVCKNSYIGISSLSMVDGQSGPVVTWKTADTIHIFNSFACDQARNEYLSLVVSGEKKMYWSMESRFLPGDRFLISNDSLESELEFGIYVEGMAPGVYQDHMLNILFEDRHLGNKGYSLFCPTASSGCGFTSFTITHFPDQAGQWIRGHFEGTFWIKTFSPLTAGYRLVEGDFQVYRDF